jgi:hypothetical protein
MVPAVPMVPNVENIHLVQNNQAASLILTFEIRLTFGTAGTIGTF